MRRLVLSFALGLSLLLSAAPAPAVTITIVNQDSAGQGLNDLTPATPVGGNPGTTIGQQRLNVFKEAARIWGQILPGDVEIKIDASFTPLDCTSNSAVLGGGYPEFVESDFPGSPVPGTWFVVSEANQLAGQDLEPGQSHQGIQFNSNLGQSGCFTGHYFYYGFDTNTPYGDVNLLTVTLHEFAHGFGFISLADESTGVLCCTDPNTGQKQLLPDIFDAFVYDTTKAKSWNQMASDADRQASAINTGNLVWNGPAANAAGAAYLVQRKGMNANGQMLLYAPNPVQVGSNVSHWDTSAIPDLLMEPDINSDLPIGVDITPDAFRDIGWWGTTPAGPTYAYVASVAHSAGGTVATPAFYTSDLFVANEGTSDANVTLKFLGHGVDGTSGAEQTLTVPAGQAVTYRDILGSVFGLTSGNSYGAIQVSANSASLKISTVTTTPTPDQTGAYGQSVPAVGASQLITDTSPGAIVGIRDDSVARTNLILVNATEQSLDVTLALYADSGNDLGTLTQSLLPLEMTQLNRVITNYLHAPSVSNATLILSTPTVGGAFTAFASLLDNGTNDPATLFASTGFGGSGAASFLVPSVARAAGGTVAAPALYTTDFFLANVGPAAANVTLQYLAFGTPDGTTGPTRSYSLNPQTAYTFRDVLGSVFGISTTADKGAILVTSSTPNFAIDSVTTTPALSGTGRFGQSVPGIPSLSWIRPGTNAAIVGVREDDTARTDLILVNGLPDAPVPPYVIDVNYAFYSDDGTQLGTTQQVTLAPLGMTQINRVVTRGVGAPTGSAGTLVLWTSTPGATFTGFASLLNNVTNDPATLLPQ